MTNTPTPQHSNTPAAPTCHDPLAHASPVPDIPALIAEAQRAQLDQTNGWDRLKVAEGERYQSRAGKDGSGRLWQKNLSDPKTLVRPWDGRPDPDALLTDETCEHEVDLDLEAQAQAVPGAESSHLTPASAAAVGELTQVLKWVRRVVEPDLEEGAELLAQVKATSGLAILHPVWRERYELVERTLDLESFIVAAAQFAGPDNAQMLYTAILDPELEDNAVAYVQQLFAYVPRKRIRQIVRDLRESGHATFIDKQLAAKGPGLQVLIPGYNYFVAGTAGPLREARFHLVVERLFQADLEARAADEGWNAAFTERAIQTRGLFSSYSEALRAKLLSAPEERVDETIELWKSVVFQFDPETGAGGLYCTVFSPHVAPGSHEEVTEEHFARHYLHGGDGRTPPFFAARREVTGPGVFDSRGVPEITESNAQVIRNLLTALLCRAHLEVDPPRALIGAGWTKKPSLAPGALLETLLPGASVQDLSPQRGSPQVGEAAIERLQRDTHRLFALPDADVHPARWQPRARRKARRALAPYRGAFTLLVSFCYQYLEPEELAAIIGHAPQLSAQDVLRHRITLTYDARGLDPEWRKQILEFFMELLSIDRGGLFDTGLMGRILGNIVDPMLTEAIMRDQQGASAALYQKVQRNVNDIMLGNPPELVELDPTAGMQLDMASRILALNPDYQERTRNNPRVQENLQTYLENLRHSEQETQLSPQQGRLGVAALPQRPVERRGAPALS